jgi:predicted DNA-binding protein with PD1-like motif
MVFRKTENGYILRLIRNEKIVEKLTDFCIKENIRSGVFYGIGAVLEAEIGFYKLDKKEYKFKKLDRPQEIVSLTGNVALVENKPFLHIHIVLASDDFVCSGGHLKEAVVGATCEVYLFAFKAAIERVFDKEIGLKLLNCKINRHYQSGRTRSYS